MSAIGYGQNGVYTWPGETFEVKKAININVKWLNKILPGEHILTGADNTGFPDITVDYLDSPVTITPTDNNNKPVVDTLLNWAYYSLDVIKGSSGFTGPCQGETGTCFEKYGVPVVIAMHLHGGHSDADFDGNPEYYFNYDLSMLGPLDASTRAKS